MPNRIEGKADLHLSGNQDEFGAKGLTTTHILSQLCRMFESSRWNDLKFMIPFADFKNILGSICKIFFTCLLSFHYIITLSHHELVCLMRLRFERYLPNHWAT